MVTPTYKPLKKNGTTLYVFPSVEEDENYKSQNENYYMRLSHYVLINIPKQTIGKTLDFENVFDQNVTSVAPATFKDALVESLRNYVANHEAVIRNSKINATTYYYDTFEPATTTEKIFWKWAKSLGIIDFETADPVQEYFGADPKYNDLGPIGNTNHYREYLWKERSTNIYDVLSVIVGSGPLNPTVPTTLPSPSAGMQLCTIQLSGTTKLEPGDYVLLNAKEIDNATPGLGYSSRQSKLLIIGLSTTVTLNDTIIVEIDNTVGLSSFGSVTDRELYNAYDRFVQFICEIGGRNNVQLPDKSYVETFAYTSAQHGQIPYSLWNIKNDNNYKPNSQYPILASEIQAEIQGGENPNMPILTNPSLYPGDIWGQFDTSSYQYTTQTGDITRRWGNYYGNNSTSNISPQLAYPEFDGSLIDGAVLNLNINDYAEAVSYIYPIETFNEFCSTAFNNVPPKDFEFNAVLWYYTIEDVTGNTTKTATNLYGIEFLDTPENDLVFMKTKVPSVKKLVSNGYQDGNSYTFSLDINTALDSDTPVPSFDPDKIYSLFGMELFYEAMTRVTYFNDQLMNFINSNISINQRMNDLTGLVYNQQSLESVRARMDNLEALLNVYSTLQIGASDTILPRLDTSVNPPVIRLDSIDKQYGYVYQYDTLSMFSEFINVNSLTDITVIEKSVSVVNGKDFLVVINNNDNRVPTIPYDTTKRLSSLSLLINKDLQYKQKMDIIVIPKTNTNPISVSNPVNEPINDKTLDIFINYNDGTSVIKQQIAHLCLPVLKYYDGTNANEELIKYLTEVPVWKTRNIFYSKPSANYRLISLYIEDDLVDRISALSRIYIDNLFLESNPATPSGTYTDMSGQYEIHNALNNPSLVKSNIVDVIVTNPGTTGYTTGTVTGIVHTSGYSYTADIAITAAGGVITGAELLNVNGLTTQTLTDAVSISVPGGTGGKIKFVVKPVTRIDIAFNINIDPVMNTFLSAYDLQTNVNTLPLNTRVNMQPYLKMNPSVTLLRGFKVSIVRISDTDEPVSLIENRYNIKIDKL